MIIYEFENGDKLDKYNRCLVAKFSGRRKVMGTSASHNGGYREDLTAIFNHDVNPDESRECPYMNQTEDDRKAFIENELGLDHAKTAYMATIVSMDNAVIETLTYDIISVTAVVTASLEVNGGRVGEEGTSYEKYGKSGKLNPGTINTMVFCNANMTPGCMARAIMTATEAKTAALQELLAPSLRSSGIATGSGTDNIMIIADAESDNLLTYSGKHGKLGELIGRTVMAATKKSLELHMGLTPESQHTMLSRLKRYGITEASLLSRVNTLPAEYDGETIMERIMKIDKDGVTVGLTSMLVHLLDQLHWGLLSESEVLECASLTLRLLLNYWNSPVTDHDLHLTDIAKIMESFMCCIVKAAVNDNKNKEK